MTLKFGLSPQQMPEGWKAGVCTHLREHPCQEYSFQAYTKSMLVEKLINLVGMNKDTSAKDLSFDRGPNKETMICYGFYCRLLNCID